MALLYPAGYDFDEASGRLYVYQNNTTTLASIYTNAELTTAHDNPIVLDSGGRAGNIYAADGTRFTVLLRDSIAAEVWSRNDVWGVLEDAIDTSYTPTGGSSRTLRSRLEQVTSVKDFGALGDGSTDDTNALQAALDSGATSVYVPEGTYIIGTSLTITSALHLHGPGTLKAESSVGAFTLLSVTAAGSRIDDITIDLQNTVDTFAGGYVADRVGLSVKGTSNASYGTGFDSTHMTIKNCGMSGMFIQYMQEVQINDVHIERCGQHGIRAFSVSNVKISNPFISKIRPGNTGTTPYLNAYGITFSRSGSDAVPVDCEVVDAYVEHVTSWEAYDTHFGKRIRFINCSSYFCNQGVSIESTTAGVESQDIQIIGGTHTSFGQTYTWDTQTYEPSSAVVANMGSTTTNGSGLLIKDVLARGHGSGRNSSNGAIKIQDAEDVDVSGCLLIDSLKRGIACVNESKNTFIHGNTIAGVTSVGSISRGIEVSSTAGEFTGIISNDNFITGTTNQTITPTEITIAAGVVTVFANFHSVDAESDASTDDLDTINGGHIGMQLTLTAQNSARSVVCKDNIGNLRLSGDFTLTHANDTIQLVFDGTNWLEVSRSDNET